MKLASHRKWLLGLLVGTTFCLGALAVVVSMKSLYAANAALKLSPTFVEVYSQANRSIPRQTNMRRVVMFGDSRISRWMPRPSAKDTEFIWRGIAGETTAQMIFRYPADVIDLNPSVVVIQAGINDIVAGVAIDQPDSAIAEAIGNISQMVEQAANEDRVVILLTAVRPAKPPLWRRPFWSSAVPQYVDRFNSSLRAIKHTHVHIMDADRILSGESKYLAPDYAIDTLHFTQTAYIRLNSVLLQILNTNHHAVQ